ALAAAVTVVPGLLHCGCLKILVAVISAGNLALGEWNHLGETHVPDIHSRPFDHALCRGSEPALSGSAECRDVQPAIHATLVDWQIRIPEDVRADGHHGNGSRRGGECRACPDREGVRKIYTSRVGPAWLPSAASGKGSSSFT